MVLEHSGCVLLNPSISGLELVPDNFFSKPKVKSRHQTGTPFIRGQLRTQRWVRTCIKRIGSIFLSLRLCLPHLWYLPSLSDLRGMLLKWNDGYKATFKTQRGPGATICFLAALNPSGAGQSWKEQQASRLPSSGPVPVQLTSSAVLFHLVTGPVRWGCRWGGCRWGERAWTWWSPWPGTVSGKRLDFCRITFLCECHCFV